MIEVFFTFAIILANNYLLNEPMKWLAIVSVVLHGVILFIFSLMCYYLLFVTELTENKDYYQR